MSSLEGFLVRRAFERSLDSVVVRFDYVICDGGNFYSASACAGRGSSWATPSPAISPSALPASSPLPPLRFRSPSDSAVDFKKECSEAPAEDSFAGAFVCCGELGNGVFYELGERLGLQAGPADECAVDLGFGHEGGDVVCFDGAAIEDAHVACAGQAKV
jgi:hypothetical protein